MEQSSRPLDMQATTYPLLPFRSKNKLLRKQDEAELPPPIPRYIFKHQRKLTLHHIHGPKTWMIDFMMINDTNVSQSDRTLYVLNLIHCNTRFWFPCMVKNQSAEVVMKAILALIRTETYPWTNGSIIDTIISDAAKTFTTTATVDEFCRMLRIQQIAYNMSEGGVQVRPAVQQPTTSQYHDQLAMIDRISRTLRDMIATVQRTKPNFTLTPKTLTQLANIYNQTPHNTLSKTMGFDVTPYDALKNRKLQDEIVRRWTVENYNLLDTPYFTSIQPGTLVYLYAPKQIFEKRRSNVESTPYVVIESHAGNYIIRNIETGQQKTVQRKDFILAR